MTYTINSDGTIVTDFDEYFPEEYIGDDLVTLVYNNGWKTSDGSSYSGNVFRKIKKFYKQLVLDGTTRQGFKIAVGYDTCPDGFYCPRYFKDDDDNEIDYALIGVYKGNVSSSKLRSVSSATMTGDFTLTNFTTYGRNSSSNGINTFAKTWQMNQLINDLFMIFFATRNTETVFGQTWRSYGFTTGVNDTLRSSCQHYKASSTSKAPMFLGIEDVIGNGFEGISNVTFDSATIYYSRHQTDISYPSSSASSLTSARTCSYTRPTSSDYIISMGYDSSEPDFEYCNSAGSTGGQSSYYCDCAYYASDNRTFWSGSIGYDAEFGLFCATGVNGLSNYYESFGTRLYGIPS